MIAGSPARIVSVFALLLCVSGYGDGAASSPINLNLMVDPETDEFIFYGERFRRIGEGWRRGRDSNPGRRYPRWFSRPVLSTTQPPLRTGVRFAV